MTANPPESSLSTAQVAATQLRLIVDALPARSAGERTLAGQFLFAADVLELSVPAEPNTPH